MFSMKSPAVASSGFPRVHHRLNSERMLEDILPLKVKNGECYHIISGGDIDSFSYLMWILRMQRVKELLLNIPHLPPLLKKAE